MRYWLDFKKLREELSFRNILEQYNVRLHEKGEQWVGPCPMPGHTGERKTDSFSANVSKGIFQCFSCHAKGNLLDFAVLMEGRDPKKGSDLRQTGIELAKRYSLQNIGSEQKMPERQKRRPVAANPQQRPTDGGAIVHVNAPLGFELRDLDGSHPYLASRGLTRETAAAFGLGVAQKGRLAGRLAIPIHDGNGTLVAYAGRLVDDGLVSPENPKYLFPGSRNHQGATYEFKKSLLLYNAHRITKPVPTLVVVEGFASVWWLAQNGLPNCVALMGSTVSGEQVTLLQELVEPGGTIVAMLDGDAPGLRGRDELYAKVAGNLFVHRPLMPLGAQPTSLTKDQLVTLIVTRPGPGPTVDQRAENICKLIGEFPCLVHVQPSPVRWNPEQFETMSLKLSSGERAAAQFVLSVWNPKTAWQCGRFDLVEAAARLDAANRKPILQWLEQPWWP